MKIETLRVAFFPDSYHEVDGVANTSRHFEAFARLRGLPFLVIHAGPRNEIVTAGSVTRIQVTRSAMTFPLVCVRTIQTLLDVIREYPEYPMGSQRWDGRVFHPDHITNTDRPVSAFWDSPPAFLERIFSAIRLLENTAVRQLLNGVLRHEAGSWRSSDIAYETTL